MKCWYVSSVSQTIGRVERYHRLLISFLKFFLQPRHWLLCMFKAYR